MPKANPKLHDKEWLREQYLVKQRTYEDIARDIGATKHGVYHAMQRYGIKARVHSSKYPQLNNKEWLRKMYVDEFLSTKQLANLLGTTVGNIHSALTHANIPTRNYKEGLRARFPNSRLGKDHPNWKGGLPICADCGKEVATYAAIRCQSCEKSDNRTGNKNANWQGGITPANKAARTTKEYKTWRKAVLELGNYTCRFCGKTEGEMHADHIKPFAYFPQLRLDISNGRVLCVDCHRKTGTWGRQKSGPLDKYSQKVVHLKSKPNKGDNTMDLTQFQQAVSDLLAETVKEDQDVQALVAAVTALVPVTPPAPTPDPVATAVVEAVKAAGLVKTFGADALSAELTSAGYTVTPPAPTTPVDTTPPPADTTPPTDTTLPADTPTA